MSQPAAAPAAAAFEQQWPPRSPREVLFYTPNGRKRYGDLFVRHSTPPSPLKPRTVSGDLASRASNMMLADPMDLDEDDDEETLQLKLEEIQAQLRLKKLRKEKARAAGGPAGSFTCQTSDLDNGRISRPSSTMPPPGHRIKEIRRTEPAARPRSYPPATVEVPASPVRKAAPPPNDASPSRILLGIDKGLKAKDISLTRAPSFRKTSDDTCGSQAGGYLRTSRSFDGKQKPPSFSERLKATRDEETAREEKRAHASRSRSTAFNVGRQEMEDYKTNATDIMDAPSPKEREYTRDEILGHVPVARSKARVLTRSDTTSSARTSSLPEASRTGHGPADLSQPQAQDSFASVAFEPHQPSSSPSFEPYSCFHLNKRILPHPVVARAITGKTAYSVKGLLRQVKAPDWSLPEDVIDCVVFAVVATKSDPRQHKPQYDPETGKMKPSDRGKFMVITLVDLDYEIDLFLFNTGFERFWKLSTGTVVAILNPDIMPPPPGKVDTGRFSLVINSDADTILEIGVARDLGYCKSVKADGKLCNSWVNARRTEHCEFHTNTALARTRGARNELNGSSGFGKEGIDFKRSKHVRYQFREQKEAAERRDRVAGSHGKLDWETRSRYFVSRGVGAGGNGVNQDAEDFAENRERAEGLKRRLQAKEKERDIAKRLGEKSGGGMGGEYMRLAATTEPTTSRPTTHTSRFGNGRSSRTTAAPSTAPPTAARFSPAIPRIPLPGTHHYQHEDQQQGERKTDARSLGLVAPRGFESKISLSPIKRKRQDSSTNSSFDCASAPRPNRAWATAGGGVGAAASSAAAVSRTFGWGTSLKDKLGRMRDGEKLNLNLNHLRLAHHHQHNKNNTSTTTTTNHTKKDSTSSGSTATTTTSALRDKDRSPVRKKTRFVTDKGIREAGRDSLPPQGAGVGDKTARPAVVLDNDADMEDLVIVR